MFGLDPSEETINLSAISLSRDRKREMENHTVSPIAWVISLQSTLRGLNVDPLYGRPALCLTGLGPFNDSLIWKLIQVCNWLSIEITGALNS